jgi:hypothetical protein
LPKSAALAADARGRRASGLDHGCDWGRALSAAEFHDILLRLIEASYPKPVPAWMIGVWADGFGVDGSGRPARTGWLEAVWLRVAPSSALSARGERLAAALVARGAVERVGTARRAAYRFVPEAARPKGDA